MVIELPMKLIGIEQHFLTPAVENAWHAMSLEATDPSGGYHQGVLGRRLADLVGERLALMDETGLDVQVLSLITPALHDLGLESVGLAQRANDAGLQGHDAMWPGGHASFGRSGVYACS
jgi:hypothetical protein